jgi:hypothetical protein
VNKKTPKLDDLLSHRPLGRIMEIGGIADEFELIRTAFEAAGKAVPSAGDFARVGGASGTHLLKLITPRAPIGQHVVRVIDKGANQHPELYPSLDAKKAPVAKLVFRPLEVSGRPARSLADHILNPDEVSETVTKGFAKAFGDEALETLRRALMEPLPEVEALPAAEFPIIFLPRPGGGDIQATPLAPAEAYVRFDEVVEPYFRKTEEGQPRVPRGQWRRQFVADKPQNISSAVGKQRRRFFARMPRVFDRWSAELHRYAHGGRFPLWRDDDVVNAVFAYADLLDANAKYSNQDIRAGLDRRADALIRAARDFVDETVADAKAEYPERDPAAPSSIVAVILGRSWPKDGYDRARRVLTSDHFKSRLKAAEER